MSQNFARRLDAFAAFFHKQGKPFCFCRSKLVEMFICVRIFHYYSIHFGSGANAVGL